MLERWRRSATVFLIAGALSSSIVPPCPAQSSGRVRRGTTSLTKHAPPVLSGSDLEAAGDVLARLRALRDCWSDPYMVPTGDDPRVENDSLYRVCDDNYQLRLVEARDVVWHSESKISNRTVRGEILAAMEVFDDLDTLYRLFERRDYYFTSVVRVSDIYQIVRKYNIQYQQDAISKVTVYRAVIPARRPHIDRLAALIPGAPRDENPTLTQDQATAAVDDLDWSIAKRQGQGYDWYLRRHPQGRHADEAERLLGQSKAALSEQAKRLAALKDELAPTVRETIRAYVFGDKDAFERLLAPEFPRRANYIAHLRPQPEVLSFEITDLTVEPATHGSEHYMARVRVLYVGTGDRRRMYDNRITYAKNGGRWQIVEWLSP